MQSKSPRGGVAVYKNAKLNAEFDTLSTAFRDCVIIKIRYTNIVIAAMYIPPRNSLYFKDIYFTNLELLLEHYEDRHLIVAGDINSRFGTLPDTRYMQNPDIGINQNGKQLKEILLRNRNHYVLNGFNNGLFESKFTFYRGKVRSQVDYVISNETHNIKSFTILGKSVYSDHCPIKLSVVVKFKPSIVTVKQCAEGLLTYNHYDVNKRIRKSVNVARLNMIDTIAALEQLAENLNLEINNNINVDDLCASLTNGVYNSCIQNTTKELVIVPENDNFRNCNSKHFQAIASMNLHTYNILRDSNVQEQRCEVYLHEWQKYEAIAIKTKNEELNTKINISWRNIKNDGKKMWNAIDWKGKKKRVKRSR